MAQEKRDNKIILRGNKARAILLSGARAAYEVVMQTYGAKGSNVLVEKVFGRPLPVRDGVTISREIYFSDRGKNMGAQLLMEASETTNRVAGDGTSLTVGLAYQLIKHGMQAIAAGTHPMQVKDQLTKDSITLLEELDKLTKPIKKNQLQQVATISSGDSILGQLIAETIQRVGEDGGIMTEKSYVPDIEREYVDGYYLQQGFQALQAGKKELIDPFVIVSSKRITSAADMVEILTRTAQSQGLEPGQIPKLLFVGNIEDAAHNMIVENINRGTIDAIIIKTPPMFGDMGNQLLEDIAIYAGCEPITESTNLRSFSTKLQDGNILSPYVGSVNKVVASHTESTIFADNSTEEVADRIQSLKDRVAEEISDAVAEKLRDRIAKLDGKIALFRIGGATDSEKEEKEFRVEDALQASRAAQKEGVVAGGGVTLLQLSGCNVSELYSKALRAVFKKLLTNANLPSELKLEEALSAPKGFGFNLREGSELVDMTKEGILDPKLVVSEAIKNATSVAGIALTTSVILLFEDRDD